MSYYISRNISSTHDEAVSRAVASLATKGFGVVCTIDVASTLKSRVGVDYRPYTILGACNPHLLWLALQEEDKIGTMLPCNVIVTEVIPGVNEISAIDPVASMASVINPRLEQVAEHMRTLLREVVEKA